MKSLEDILFEKMIEAAKLENRHPGCNTKHDDLGHWLKMNKHTLRLYFADTIQKGQEAEGYSIDDFAVKVLIQPTECVSDIMVCEITNKQTGKKWMNHLVTLHPTLKP